MKEYIERAAVLNRLSKVEMDGYGFSQGIQFGVDHAINCIKEATAADVVEVRHGRWEKHPQSNEDDPVYTCSLCKLNVSGFEKRWIKYCPNCGALMQEEDNGEK